jgi:fumarate hydratase class I
MIGKIRFQTLNLSRRLLLRSSSSTTPAFFYQSLFDLSEDTTTEYKKLTSDFVSTVNFNNHTFLKVEPEGLRVLSAQAMVDIAHLLRPAHLQQLSNILKDSEATENDKFVALELLKNANIASNFILPGCQDTGTAIVLGKSLLYLAICPTKWHDYN